MYAIQLRLMDRHCIVLGGGRVAQRKVRPLLAEGALVEVIAPALCGELQQLAAAGKIRWRAAGYTAGCLAGAFLVFCATDDLAVNAAAAAEAQRQGSLVNVAAPPEQSDFQVPASIRRGRLQLTVSTGGASPAFSRLLRERLEREYGRVYGEWLEGLERLRAELRKRPGTSREREHFWRQILTEDILALVEQGKLEEAEAEVRNAINGFGTQS